MEYVITRCSNHSSPVSAGLTQSIHCKWSIANDLFRMIHFKWSISNSLLAPATRFFIGRKIASKLWSVHQTCSPVPQIFLREITHPPIYLERARASWTRHLTEVVECRLLATFDRACNRGQNVTGPPGDKCNRLSLRQLVTIIANLPLHSLRLGFSILVVDKPSTAGTARKRTVNTVVF